MKDFSCKGLEGVEIPEAPQCDEIFHIERCENIIIERLDRQFTRSPLEACVKVMHEFDEMRRLLLKAK